MSKGIYQHTKEHHQKIIATRRQRYGVTLLKNPNEINKRRSIALKGNQHTKGMKFPNKKMPPWSSEHRKNMEGKSSRENNGNWKGGISQLTVVIRSCLKSRQWTSDIYTRDNYTCQECGTRGGNLNAHHIKEFNLILKENNIKTYKEAIMCEELWNLNNGITLCVSCHKKTFKFFGNKYV